ncbi:hypothetical protein BSKO_08250 [Bryopsis sp. KO-2023]|nr:hypothetical protein BSKO_08250 [Bryopsis sp. KO-2023]
METPGFDQRRSAVLVGLQENDGDKSRKGSVDAPIVDLVNLINGRDDIFTTSSCSGRLSVFGDPVMESVDGQKMKGGEWVYMSHAEPIALEVIQAINERVGRGGIDGCLFLRFDPFILAAECRSTQAANLLVHCGRDSGFRESGITFGNHKIMAAVRSSNRLEVPIVRDGKLLVSEEYLNCIIQIACERFHDNARRVGRFQEEFMSRFDGWVAHQNGGVLAAEENGGRAVNGISLKEEAESGMVSWRNSEKGNSEESLKRWGHSACVLDDDRVAVFGGYGGSGTHRRLNDLLIFNQKTSEWTSPKTSGDIPTPRMGHACVALGNAEMLLIGGRHSPTSPLDDVYTCREAGQSQWTFRRVQTQGGGPRVFRHCAGAHDGKVFVFGGCTETHPTNECWRLDTRDWTWKLLETSGSAPSPRMGHASCVVGSIMYVHGGFTDYKDVRNDLFAFDMVSMQWSQIQTQPPAPRCFSHTMDSIRDNTLALIGGCPQIPSSDVVLIDVRTGMVSTIETTRKSVGERGKGFVPVRHAAVMLGGNLHAIGGGAFCFSFGSVFSDSCFLPVTDLAMQQEIQGKKSSWCLWVKRKSAKGVKDELKSRGWLDVTLKSSTKEEMIGLAISDSGANTLKGMTSSVRQGEQGPDKPASLEGSPPPNGNSSVVNAFSDGGYLAVDYFETSKRKKAVSPHESLAALVRGVLSKNQVSGEQLDALMLDLPAKWEKLEDLILIPESSMTSEIWARIGSDGWKAVAKGLGGKRLARQKRIANTGTRDSQADMLLGSKPWVEHKESGVIFSLDVTKCMFSSGNVTERTRMGKLSCSRETVVDLYTGIGYYTLPLLCKAKAAKVYACEWNPNAVEALRKNLEVNGVKDRCEILQGDCRECAPAGVADRVMLGLLPSSEGGWKTAVRALKASGGWLHIHENVNDFDEKDWVAGTVAQLAEIANKDMDRGWDVRLAHRERVKWYAPHVRHIVLDIKCTPLSDMSSAPPNDDSSTSRKKNRKENRKTAKNRSERKESGKKIEVRKKFVKKSKRAEAKTSRQSPVGKNGAPPQVKVFEGVLGLDDFQKMVVAPGQPVIMRGLNIAPKWTNEYLINHDESIKTLVSTHVYSHSQGLMDFVDKNFVFRTLTLKELLERCLAKGDHPPMESEGEKYYLRTLGKNPRKEPSCLTQAFPELSKDLNIPECLSKQPVFSSVLRVSSPGARLWTHFDAMDNVLMQITGSKRIRLWPPEEEPNLYIVGSSSSVIDVENPDLAKFPLFGNARYVDVNLNPGDSLFIPALWFHNVLSEDFSVSINIFFHYADRSLHDRKDLYGNREPLPVQEAEKLVEQALGKMKGLPTSFKKFYGGRLLRKMEQGVLGGGREAIE